MVLKAKSPDQSRISYNGSYYQIYDSMPSLEMAKETAADMRKAPYPLSTGNFRCKVVIVDLGEDAGRLRYGLFVAKGEIVAKKSKVKVKEETDVIFRVAANRMTDSRMCNQQYEEITIGHFKNEKRAEDVADQITKTHKLPEWFVKKATNPNRYKVYWDYAKVSKIKITGD